MRILVTGGTGYIGSHTALALLEAGYEVVVVDNLSNSSEEALRRVQNITGKKADFHKLDVCDFEKLSAVFEGTRIDAVIHFAGLKAVGESVAKPLYYYQNNLLSSLTLCRVMEKFGVHKLIFSSSCTVYGNPDKVPITEDMPIRPVSPYGQTKAMIEQILKDLVVTNQWQISLLRYFNPVGAHQSGLIGEDPNGIPNSLVPGISQFAIGKLKEFDVYGDDYDTPDGTCIRDYIHVVDLALAHIAALEHLPEPKHLETYNIGTGQGKSVLEVIKAFEKAIGGPIDYKITKRRLGDVVSSYANCDKATKELNWKTTKSLEDACVDMWRWQTKNPNGYK